MWGCLGCFRKKVGLNLVILNRRTTSPVLQSVNNMENADEDEDLKLLKASPGLLAELESSIPRLLFKSPSKHRAHTRVKKRDLDNVVNLVR